MPDIFHMSVELKLRSSGSWTSMLPTEPMQYPCSPISGYWFPGSYSKCLCWILSTHTMTLHHSVGPVRDDWFQERDSWKGLASSKTDWFLLLPPPNEDTVRRPSVSQEASSQSIPNGLILWTWTSLQNSKKWVCVISKQSSFWCSIIKALRAETQNLCLFLGLTEPLRKDKEFSTY